jgi:HAD superfamily hydrolase (TIGR01458 family)
MHVQALLVDLDGTLYVGEQPVEGARAALQTLEAAGIEIRYVTNTTRIPRMAVRERLESLGYDVDEARIYTPAVAAARLLRGKTCLPLVGDALLDDLDGVVFGEVDVECVLVGDLGDEFTYAVLNRAFRALMDGAALVALQKNRYWQTSGGLSLDAGPFVAALEYASSTRATMVGKPEEAFFRLALDDLELEPGVLAMVGDDPEADMAGARAAGLRGIAVRTGKFRDGDEADADLVVESVAELPAALGLG